MMQVDDRMSLKRKVYVLVACVGLAFTYLLQDFFSLQHSLNWQLPPSIDFVAKKSIRLILNDVFVLLLVYAWFNNRSITRLALGLQLIDTFILLPLYLIMKLNWEGPAELSSPLLSQLHRFIVNPFLLLLLIPAVYFQKSLKQSK